jgi:hypothetical protein
MNAKDCKAKLDYDVEHIPLGDCTTTMYPLARLQLCAMEALWEIAAQLAEHNERVNKPPVTAQQIEDDIEFVKRNMENDTDPQFILDTLRVVMRQRAGLPT